MSAYSLDHKCARMSEFVGTEEAQRALTRRGPRICPTADRGGVGFLRTSVLTTHSRRTMRLNRRTGFQTLQKRRTRSSARNRITTSLHQRTCSFAKSSTIRPRSCMLTFERYFSPHLLAAIPQHTRATRRWRAAEGSGRCARPNLTPCIDSFLISYFAGSRLRRQTRSS